VAIFRDFWRIFFKQRILGEENFAQIFSTKWRKLVAKKKMAVSEPEMTLFPFTQTFSPFSSVSCENAWLCTSIRSFIHSSM
jgi:hypothetical protein